ncbi:UNVERIFIED_CONTAM: hypothetical protein HDU68_008819, partial [Siphonaria sp. JEL0065]
MSELKEKKDQLNVLTSHLTQLTANLLYQNPILQQQNIPPFSPTSTSPTKGSPSHSPTRALIKTNNPQQSLQLQSLPQDESTTISSLRTILASKTQELSILRDVIKGAAKQFDSSLAPARTLQDIEAIKAWNVALSRRVKELEAILSANGISASLSHSTTLSQNPERGRGLKSHRTIETQTWDVPLAASSSNSDSATRQHQETIKSLSTQNASLLIQVESLKSTDAATTIQKLQSQVVDLKLASKEMDSKLRNLSAENHDLKTTLSNSTYSNKRASPTPGRDSETFHLTVNKSQSPSFSEVQRKLFDSVHKVSALESTNSRLVKDNNALREEIESLSRQVEQDVRVRHESKQAVHEASLVIKKLKEGAVRKDQELVALKAQWDKERLRWIEERKKSVENLAENAAALGVRDGNFEIVEQLQVELNRYKRESEKRNLDFTVTEAEFLKKVAVLEETVKQLEAEKLGSQSLLSEADLRDSEAQNRIIELERALKLVDADHGQEATNYRIRIAELSNALRDLESRLEQQQLNESQSTSHEKKVLELQKILSALEADVSARSIEFATQLQEITKDRDALSAEVISLQQHHNKEMGQLSLERDSLATKLDNQKQEIDQLTKDRDALSHQLDLLQDQNSQTMPVPPKPEPSSSTATTPSTTPSLLVLNLQTENTQLKDALTSLNQDLEASNTRYFTLSQTLKKTIQQHKTELEFSSTIPRSEHEDVLERHAYQLEALQHQLEIQKDRYHASQAKSQSLLDALNRKESELARLRLSQADIGTTLLMKGNDADSKDLIRTLQSRNGELASEVMRYREEVEELEARVEMQKMRAYERESLVVQAGELKRELDDLGTKTAREKETWILKERALYNATEKLQSDYQDLVKTMTNVKQVIWKSAESRTGWNRGASGERVEDVDVLAWVQWMADVNSRLELDLTHSHEIMDMQQEKIESVIGMSSAAVSRRSHSPRASESGRRSSRGFMSERGDEFGVGQSLSSSSSSVNALMNWSKSVADIASSSGYHSHTQPTTAECVREDESQDIVLPLPLPFDKKLSSEKVASTMKKLMSKNVSLQQKLSSIEAQLEHQIKSNTEIKKMFVDSALGGVGGSGGNNGSGPILEQYNDALIEIGALRSEVEHWRARYDEMEQVVEGVVI